MSRKTAGYVKPAIHVVGDVLDNTAQLISETVPPSDTLLEVEEKIVSFGKVPQSLEDDFLNNLAEGVEDADWAITGNLLWWLSSFLDINDRCTSPRVQQV